MSQKDVEAEIQQFQLEMQVDLGVSVADNVRLMKRRVLCCVRVFVFFHDSRKLRSSTLRPLIH